MVQKNERIKSVGNFKEGTCLKGKAEISGGALKLQKSQECCRRKEESGRIPLEGQRTRRKRREVLQKRWGMKKKDKEWQREFQRKLKEFEGME